MPIVPVQEWLPDAAPLGAPGSPVVENCLPGTNSYKPMPQYSTLTDALVERPTGAIDVRDKSSNVFQYVGTAAALYQANNGSWTDVSKAGGYSTSGVERWQFVKWKNKVLGTNWDDNPQSVELGGSAFADMTTDFRCRQLAVVGDHVIAANTFDATDGLVPDRVRISAFNNEALWTIDPSTGADVRDLKGGPIQRAYGGQYGIFLGLSDTWRMDYVGGRVFFQIDRTLPGVGTLAPGASTRIGDVIYNWSNQGFVAISAGTGLTPLGAGKVDRYAFNDLDDNYLDRISSVADPSSGRIFWAYPGAGNVEGRPNCMICYDRNLDKFSFIKQELEFLWAAGGDVGFSLEDLDTISASLDDLAVSLDSSQWKGDGEVLLAAFGTEFKHGFFDGAPMEGVVDLREVEIHAGGRTMLNAFRPLVDGGEAAARVGTRNIQTEDVVFGPELTPTATGRVTSRNNARYHRLRVIMRGAWKECIGAQFERHDARRVGFRG